MIKSQKLPIVEKYGWFLFKWQIYSKIVSKTPLREVFQEFTNRLYMKKTFSKIVDLPFVEEYVELKPEDICILPARKIPDGDTTQIYKDDKLVKEIINVGN